MLDTTLQVTTTSLVIPGYIFVLLDKNGLSLPWNGSIYMCPDQSRHIIRIKVENEGGRKPFFKRIPGDLETKIQIKIVNVQCVSIE